MLELRTMDLSVMQPGAASAQDGIFASFLAANTGTDNPQAGLFESLLEDAFGQAAPIASTSIDGNSASPVAVQQKGGRHKKSEAKNEGTENTGTAALYALSIAPVPLEPLQLDHSALAQANSGQARQSQPISDGTTKATQQAGPPRSDSSTSTQEIPSRGFRSWGFKSSPDPEVSETLAPSLQETQDIGSIVQEAPLSKSTQKASEYFEKNVGQKLAAQALNDSTLTATQSQPDERRPNAAQPPLTQTELSLAYADSAMNDAGDGPLIDAVAGNAIAQRLRELISPAAQNPTSTTLSATPVPVPPPVVRNASGVQTAAIASPPVQPPGLRHQHAADQKPQMANSGTTQSKNPADLLKSSAANVSTRVSATHRVTINTQAAESGSLANANAQSSAPDTTPTSPPAARVADRKSGQSQTSDQTTPGAQNTQTATATLPSARAVTPPVANTHSASSAGVASAPSQPVPGTPLSVTSPSAPKPALHDLHPATPDAFLPVQVHASRIVQGNNRAEMRIDMQTQAFGGVEVHTSVSGKNVQLSVGSEHGDLHSFLAPEMPVLQSNLQQHDLRLEQVRTVLNNGTQQEFSSGSERRQQRSERPQARSGTFDRHSIVGIPDEEESPKGLSIRI